MFSLLFFSLASAASKFVNTDIQRQYSINQNLITVAVTAEVTNKGDQSAREYTFSVTPREAQYIGHTTASFIRKNARSFENSLKITNNGNNFIVDLNREVAPGESFTIFFAYTLGDYFRFVRQKVSLNQKMQLYFATSRYYNSPYETLKSTIHIKGISKGQILKKTEDPELTVQTNLIKLSVDHSEINDNNKNDLFEVEFQTSGSLPRIDVINSRTVVSHWGKTKQSAFYSITNAGPKFVGEFNRIDFTQQSPCYLQNLDMRPPSGSYNFWASDESGLLQKDMYLHGDSLEIPLRGPMLSSWKATFTVGWTIDTAKFVSGHYTYTAPLLTPFITAPVTEATAEIILPEGAKVKNVSVPVDANVTQLTEVHNLDFNGRVVIRIEIDNLSSEDIVPIKIDYSLDYSYNFLKILLLGSAFSVFFCGIAIFRRLDFSIKV